MLLKCLLPERRKTRNVDQQLMVAGRKCLVERQENEYPQYNGVGAQMVSESPVEPQRTVKAVKEMTQLFLKILYVNSGQDAVL